MAQTLLALECALAELNAMVDRYDLDEIADKDTFDTIEKLEEAIEDQSKSTNMNLKAVYYCATSGNTWGKGMTVKEAKKNARVGAHTKEYYVQAALFNDPTEEELKNLFTCIQSDQISGSPKYYDSDRLEEDTEMINRLHVGWLLVESTIKKPKS